MAVDGRGGGERGKRCQGARVRCGGDGLSRSGPDEAASSTLHCVVQVGDNARYKCEARQARKTERQ